MTLTAAATAPVIHQRVRAYTRYYADGEYSRARLPPLLSVSVYTVVGARNEQSDFFSIVFGAVWPTTNIVSRCISNVVNIIIRIVVGFT